MLSQKNNTKLESNSKLRKWYEDEKKYIYIKVRNNNHWLRNDTDN